MTKAQTLRILDANFNRSREGLRVCEEIARFVWEDRKLSVKLKKSRHDISGVLQSISCGFKSLVSARNVRSDVGKKFSRLESARKDSSDLFIANLERVKESLRVLEEVSKLVDVDSAEKFKKIRFNIYALEKKSLSNLETLRHH